MRLKSEAILPKDKYAGTLVGRAWVPGANPGPSVVVFRESGVYDLSAIAPTMSSLLEHEDPVRLVRSAEGRRIGRMDEILENTRATEPDGPGPRLLAPCDLQVVKAAGVTFAASLLERLIEERAGGDPQQATEIRTMIRDVLGEDLRRVRPGSRAAVQLKTMLSERGMWSQYLEVGIGPDAELFTKAPVLASVGTGDEIGIHPDSAWNNPEPEVVLAISSGARIMGASLGNDVNLRDVEGRSALLLSRAKDNNASCAIGPFIRLFDETFSLDDVRCEDIELLVEGSDGFKLKGASTMREISRDPQELVTQTIGVNHQYPDGVMLFLGTLFAPVEDRDVPGQGFTHRMGDIVTIRSPRLGALCNRVTTSDRARPWQFGIRALYAHLAARGALGARI